MPDFANQNFANIGVNNGSATQTNAGDSWGWLNSLIGGTKDGVEQKGWGAPVLGGINGLAQSWLGFKQLGLAKDQLNFTKDSFMKQYDTQAMLTTQQLQDQWRARESANPGGYGAMPGGVNNYDGSANGVQAGYNSVGSVMPQQPQQPQQRFASPNPNVRMV